MNGADDIQRDSGKTTKPSAGPTATASSATLAATHDAAALAPIAARGQSAEPALLAAQAAAQAKRLDEASRICADVLAASPNHPAALALQGSIAAAGGDLQAGVILLRRAVDLCPGNPSWYAHLSSLCRTTCQIEDALAMAREAARLEPHSAEHLVNLSLALTDADRHEDATACLLRAVGLKHNLAEAHLAMAQNLLALGDFAPGWLEYEWRNLTEAAKATLPPVTSPPWNGMHLPRGRLLLIGDQGYGDTIQFARYIPMAAHRCPDLILGCNADVGPLLAGMSDVQQCFFHWNDIPDHVVHCRLSSLPFLFHTRADTIPAPIPYIKANPARVSHWRSRLAELVPPEAKRIGLAWTGRPTHPNDRRRSIPLSSLAAVVRAGPAAFVSLQKPVSASDLAAMTRFPRMIDFSAELTDFGETAALIENLDLVVTVDTAIAHLATAMGRPVWILIPKAADWRWLLDRDDSPWYPTARLFRQRQSGGWDEPLRDLCSALGARLA